ncbi:MAG TPA: hypothetical protein PKM21_14200 [Anaerolineales bacterium]|nr:hypothetical protein [Anaerolineales bacterium]
MLLFDQGPIETTNYMILGYAVIFGVMLIYLVSLYLRRRRLKQDLQVFEEIDKKGQ